jgi:hypothetical protein
VPNAGYDVRVVIIGSTVFGYHRDVPRGEFRASGMNMVRWDPPCKESIDLARRVATIFDLPHVAVDMLLDDEGRHRIIEMSMFWRIDVLGEMLHDGVSGGYHVDEDGACTFRPMRVWPQELALKNVLQTRWIEQQRSLA